jgi:hypothetical protein
LGDALLKTVADAGVPVPFGVLAGQLCLLLVLPVLSGMGRGRVEFAVFATAYFLSQVPVLLVAFLVFPGTLTSDERKLFGGDHP